MIVQTHALVVPVVVELVLDHVTVPALVILAGDLLIISSNISAQILLSPLIVFKGVGYSSL